MFDNAAKGGVGRHCHALQVEGNELPLCNHSSRPLLMVALDLIYFNCNLSIKGGASLPCVPVSIFPSDKDHPTAVSRNVTSCQFVCFRNVCTANSFQGRGVLSADEDVVQNEVTATLPKKRAASHRPVRRATDPLTCCDAPPVKRNTTSEFVLAIA